MELGIVCISTCLCTVFGDLFTSVQLSGQFLLVRNVPSGRQFFTITLVQKEFGKRALDLHFLISFNWLGLYLLYFITISSYDWTIA